MEADRIQEEGERHRRVAEEEKERVCRAAEDEVERKSKEADEEAERVRKAVEAEHQMKMEEEAEKVQRRIEAEAEKEAEEARKRAAEAVEKTRKRVEEEMERARRRVVAEAELAKKRADEESERVKRRVEAEAERVRRKATEEAERTKRETEERAQRAERELAKKRQERETARRLMESQARRDEEMARIADKRSLLEGMEAPPVEDNRFRVGEWVRKNCSFLQWAAELGVGLEFGENGLADQTAPLAPTFGPSTDVHEWTAPPSAEVLEHDSVPPVPVMVSSRSSEEGLLRKAQSTMTCPPLLKVPEGKPVNREDLHPTVDREVVFQRRVEATPSRAEDNSKRTDQVLTRSSSTQVNLDRERDLERSQRPTSPRSHCCGGEFPPCSAGAGSNAFKKLLETQAQVNAFTMLSHVRPKEKFSGDVKRLDLETFLCEFEVMTAILGATAAMKLMELKHWFVGKAALVVARFSHAKDEENRV